MNPPDLVEMQSCLKGIVNSVDRSGEVLDGIRSLFQGSERARQEVDLNEVVCEVLQTLAPELQRLDVSIVQGLRGDIPVVFGNRAQLRQVLSNIVRCHRCDERNN
jgi:C4-dicarboxylate-specific signal transduction histidine kinase